VGNGGGGGGMGLVVKPGARAWYRMGGEKVAVVWA